MGGVLIVGSVLISTLLWARLNSVYVWTAMVATLGFAAIGFVDDYSKMAKQRSLGLTGRQKLLAQLLVAVGLWAVLFSSTKLMGGAGYSWNFSIPFFKATADPFGKSFIGPYIYLILIVVVLLGSSNAVNLTDGLDGLAISVTFIAMSALTGFTYLSSDARWAEYLDLTHRPEAAELTVFCGAMVGASLGFLWYNAPPAQVFMGDVGSLAIGGAMGTVAVLTKQEFMLLMVGGVFVIEAAVGDAASGRLQDDEAHDGHRAAFIQDDAAASSFRNAGLERVEDCFPVFDFGDFVCVVEFVDVETAVSGALCFLVARKF